MEAMSLRSVLLVSLYTLEFLVSLFTFVSLTNHLNKKMQSGIVSGFMTSLWIFMFFLSLQMLASVGMRYKNMYLLDGGPLASLIDNLWLVSHIGTTAFLSLVGIFVIRKRFDIYIVTKSKEEVSVTIERNGEHDEL